MSPHTLTARFTSRDGAIAAASDLRRRGLSSTVTLSPEADRSAKSRPAAASFWAWLETLFGGTAERDAYPAAESRGATVLTAVVGEARAHETFDVLDDQMSNRVDRWRPSWRDAYDGEVWVANDATTDDRTPDAVPPSDRGFDVAILPEGAAAGLPGSDEAVGRRGVKREDTARWPYRPQIQASLTRMAQERSRLGAH